MKRKKPWHQWAIKTGLIKMVLQLRKLKHLLLKDMIMEADIVVTTI